MTRATRVYDESSLVARLAPLDRQRKTAFAAACAQRLFPLFERYARTAGDLATSQRLAEILETVWLCASGSAADISSMGAEAESMVPPDDDRWTFESGYAQNAAAAAAYAIRTWLTNDPQEAAWTARQVYDAADYAFTQVGLEPGNIYVSTFEDRTREAEAALASGIVQTALTAIDQDLQAVESAMPSFPDLQETSTAQGVAWAASFP